jgi:hypothetical protein
MKNLKIFFVTALLAIAFCFSCSKDNSSSSAPYTSGSSGGSNGSSGNNSKNNKEILTTTTWKLTKVIVNNIDKTSQYYKSCELDNDWQFKGSEHKSVSRGIPCKNGEANGSVYETKKWIMTNPDGFIMSINDNTATILSISTSSVRIRVSINQENWDYTYIAK